MQVHDRGDGPAFDKAFRKRAIGVERELVNAAQDEALARVEIGESAFGTDIVEVLNLRIRAADGVVVNRFSERVRGGECESACEAAVGAKPEAVVAGVRDGLLHGDARECGVRAQAIDALVGIAQQAQVAALAANIANLEQRAELLALHVEVVRVDDGAFKIGVNRVYGATGAGGQAEWVCEVHVRRVVDRGGEGRVRAESTDDVGNGLIVIETEAAADDSFRVAGRVVGKSQAWAEVGELAFVRPVDSVGSDLEDRVAGKVIHAEAIVDFVRDAVVFPADAEVHGELRGHAEIVLREGSESVGAQAGSGGQSGFGGGTGRAR